jgi:hypothetical protein
MGLPDVTALLTDSRVPLAVRPPPESTRLLALKPPEYQYDANGCAGSTSAQRTTMVGKVAKAYRQVIFRVAIHGQVASNVEWGTSRVRVRQRGVQRSERERAAERIHAIKAGAGVGPSRRKGERMS